MKYITIFFDFEGKWGMPYKCKYNLVKTTHILLSILAKYNVKAVFFVVGKIVEEYPNLIKEIDAKGHEIAIHGYIHEHLEILNDKQLKIFSNNLLRIGDTLETLIGKKPAGFRSPYLMSPKFYSTVVYQLLENHGYKWVSNREFRYTEELFRPDRIRLSMFWGKNNWYTSVLNVFLNIGILINENINGHNGLIKLISNLKWLVNGAKPLKRGNIIEVPLYSPLDCDLLGLPYPEMKTTDEWIRYASLCLIGGIKRKGNFYILNFHDWIIGSSNRIQILEDTIKILKFDRNNEFITATGLLKLIT